MQQIMLIQVGALHVQLFNCFFRPNNWCSIVFNGCSIVLTPKELSTNCFIANTDIKRIEHQLFYHQHNSQRIEHQLFYHKLQVQRIEHQLFHHLNNTQGIEHQLIYQHNSHKQ